MQGAGPSAAEKMSPAAEKLQNIAKTGDRAGACAEPEGVVGFCLSAIAAGAVFNGIQ